MLNVHECCSGHDAAATPADAYHARSCGCYRCCPAALRERRAGQHCCSGCAVLQAMAAAVRRGEPAGGNDRFDSNCITPGTAFMARLGAHLRFFVRRKMAEDPVWQQPRVIFSGKPPRRHASAVISSIFAVAAAIHLAPGGRAAALTYSEVAHCVFSTSAGT